MNTRIERTGTVNFGDASVSVWEEGLSNARNVGLEVDWTKRFKLDVFQRIVRALKKAGWTVGQWEDAAQYRAIADLHRSCRKGAMRGQLSLGGRHIEFKMWQGVNTPTRPDHGGRYESNLEGCMPYVLRLEMERTRRRIRDALLNTFTGYSFDVKRRSIYHKPLGQTAREAVQAHYDSSWHYKGQDWQTYLAKNDGLPYNRKSADGVLLDHGQRVWFYDHKGRLCTGTALYNINNMWWVITGKYDYTNKGCSELHTTMPAAPRARRNGALRSKRLQDLLAAAVKAMDFERAAKLRDIAFPKNEPLFLVYHMERGLYHRPNFSGYANNPVDAGKFTQAELKGWDVAPNRVVKATADSFSKAA